MLNTKKSVVIKVYTPEMLNVMNRVVDVWKLLHPGITPTITRGCEKADGSLSNSKHYINQALDFRIRNIANFLEKVKTQTYLQDLLGDDYDVVLKEHLIHIEYDPKG